MEHPRYLPSGGSVKVREKMSDWRCGVSERLISTAGFGRLEMVSL